MRTVFKLPIKAEALAKRFAKEGPRVAAVAKSSNGEYVALPGFMDADVDELKQIALYTPDGRQWMPTLAKRRSQ